MTNIQALTMLFSHQVFSPKNGDAFVCLLAPASCGDDIRLEDFVAFYFDGTFGVQIYAGIISGLQHIASEVDLHPGLLGLYCNDFLNEGMWNCPQSSLKYLFNKEKTLIHLKEMKIGMIHILFAILLYLLLILHSCKL